MLPHPLEPTAPRSATAHWRRPAVLLLVLSAAFSQLACSGLGGRLPAVTDIVRPYQIDVQQGNVVTREQLDAIRVGMPRAQVREVLGSPLLTSVFHADRWDYAFTFKRQGLPLQTRKLTVFFKGDVLDRVEADPLPTEAEFVSSLDVRSASGKAPVLEASEEQLRNFQARSPAPAVPASAAAAPVGAAPVTYPPLETTGTPR